MGTVLVSHRFRYIVAKVSGTNKRQNHEFDRMENILMIMRILSCIGR
jgi:hypothetical protein